MGVTDLMECGGKRGATRFIVDSVRGFQNQRSPPGSKRRRRCALPAHSIRSWSFRRALGTCCDVGKSGLDGVSPHLRLMGYLRTLSSVPIPEIRGQKLFAKMFDWNASKCFLLR
jgi:hypothetical protein